MAYTKTQIETIFNLICNRIEQGESLRAVLRSENMPSSQTFFIWVDDDQSKSKHYARAISIRADDIFDEILEISDDNEGDDEAFVGVNRIHRHKLRIDARKWALAKMNPKKYGEKLQLDSTINDKRKTISELFPSFNEEDKPES